MNKFLLLMRRVMIVIVYSYQTKKKG